MVLPLILLLILSVRNSVAKECPPPESIAPCICGTNPGFNLNCTALATEEELRTILHSPDYPDTNFDGIYMRGCNFESLGADLFGQLTADIISLVINEKLQSVDVNVFRGPMSDYARVISFKKSPLLQVVDLRVLEVLTMREIEFEMTQNDATEIIPPSKPTEVYRINLDYNNFTEIRNDMFVNLIGLKYLNMYKCGIKQIEEGSFAHLVDLEDLQLGYNDIGPVLQPGTFLLSSTVYRLILDNNNIETVMPGAISGFYPRAHINLESNGLNSFPEESYRPILETLVSGRGTLVLSNNFDLPCDDCSIVWLFLNPELMVPLSLYQCDPFTEITDIDPAPLVEECT